MFDGKGAVYKDTSSQAADGNSGIESSVLTAFKEEAKEQTGELLASKGIAWSAANWVEAKYDFLSRQEAEKIGEKIGDKALKNWAKFLYVKDVVENHQRFNSWQNALNADGYDMIPLSVGMATTAISAPVKGGTKFGIGLFFGLLADWYVDKQKSELEIKEVDNKGVVKEQERRDR